MIQGPAGSQPIGNPFTAPGVMEKLAQDPRTKEMLKDPSYQTLLKELQTNPSKLSE